MVMYRLMKNLIFGERIVPRGSIKRLGLDDEAIAILLERGAIALIASPPISEIPLWGKKAKKLEEVGVLLVEHLLEADEAKIAEHMDVTKEAVQAWKKELAGWLQPPLPESGRRCKAC